MRLLFLPLLALLASCAPDLSVPRAILIPKVSARPSLAPAIERAAKAEASTASLTRDVEQVDTAVDAALEAVRKAGRPEVKPLDLASYLSEARIQLGMAKAAATAAKAEAKSQADTVSKLARDLQTQEARIADQTRELDQYRQALPQANKTIEADAKVIKKVPGLIADKARNGVYRTWIIGLIVCVLLALAIFIGIKGVKAAAKAQNPLW